MGQRGLWDEQRVVQDLRDRRFPLIFMRHGAYRWSRAGQAAFDDSYEPAFQGSIDIYRPRVYPLHPQYSLGCEMGSPAELRLAGVSLGPGVAADGIARAAISVWLSTGMPAPARRLCHLCPPDRRDRQNGRRSRQPAQCHGPAHLGLDAGHIRHRDHRLAAARRAGARHLPPDRRRVQQRRGAIPGRAGGLPRRAGAPGGRCRGPGCRPVR